MVGVLLGAALSSSSAPPATSSRSSSDALPQNAPPPALPPVIPDTECGTAKPSHGPALCMNLSSGDSDDTFSVQGSGFAPQAPVTVSLDWQSPPQLNQSFHRTSAVKPVVGRNGTFRFTVNQLNPGSLPLGQYNVVVIAPGGQKSGTEFVVLPETVSPH